MLNFATDAWTSLNHKAYVVVTVHFHHNGKPLSMLLDIVEIAERHTSVTLAATFARVLEEFGITLKVSHFLVFEKRKH